MMKYLTEEYGISSMGITGIVVITLCVVLIVSVIVYILINQYYKLHTKTEYMKKELKNKHRYVVVAKTTEVYEHPTFSSPIMDGLYKNQTAITTEYKSGFYYLPSSCGWVHGDSVTVYLQEDNIPEWADDVISTNIKKYRFSLLCNCDEMIVYSEPSISSRIRASVKNENQVLLSNRYEDNWFYVDSFNGWVHESQLQVKLIY